MERGGVPDEEGDGDGMSFGDACGVHGERKTRPSSSVQDLLQTGMDPWAL